jgi:hypothetical protein
MTLTNFDSSASFPIEIVGGDGRRHTVICAAVAKDGQGRRVCFDPDGRAYQPDGHGSLRHFRAEEHDLSADEPKPSGEPRSSNQLPDQRGFVVHVFDAGTGDRIGQARVTSEGYDSGTGRLRYRDADGKSYIAASSGKGVNPL